jgi:hypothetical protein
MTKNFHSVPRGDNWAVKKEGIEKPISIHRTQVVAENKVHSLAKQNKVEAVYHRSNGTIKDKDSFGNDPHPPIDRRH